jgi:hypothetical protein
LKGEGEEILERGFAPLSLSLPLPLLREGGKGDRLIKLGFTTGAGVCYNRLTNE